MKTYENFARVYDELMDNVPYEEWADFLQTKLEGYGITDGLMLDLACGTGKLTTLMAQRGFDMIGVDSSVDMLQIARERVCGKVESCLYLLQDMREFELYGTVRAIVSICDSINYITDPDDLRQVFHWADNYLDPDGVFIFDFNTEYKYREVLGDQTIAENRETCSFIWDNYYYEEERINEYELSLFIREEEQDRDGYEMYRRYQETHYQRAYTLEEMQELLEAAGMRFLAAYDAFTKERPTDTSERIYVIAGKGERA